MICCLGWALFFAVLAFLIGLVIGVKAGRDE